MRYSTEPRNRKYIEGYVFSSFGKGWNTATKTGADAAKTASKRVVQKKTSDLIGNKIPGKITLAGKTKDDTTEPQQNNGMNETQKIYNCINKSLTI